MVICPIAIAVHCTGCPFFKFCPAKSVLGDYKKGEESAEKSEEQKGPDEKFDQRQR